MKAAVPREIVNAGGGFEEDDGLSLRGRRVARYETRCARDLEIIEAADESAINSLLEKFVHHNHMSLRAERSNLN